MEIRPLEIDDYNKGYLSLLEQLTYVGKITKEDFGEYFKKVNTNIFVVELNGKIIATGALLIEHKFIHELSHVGHIEDIVVDVDHRDKKLGKKIIQHLIDFAHINKCYKIILNCSPELQSFYEKCGFSMKNIEMSKYFA